MNFSVNDYLMLGVFIDIAITSWVYYKSSDYRNRAIEENDEVNRQKYQRQADVTLLVTLLLGGLGAWLFGIWGSRMLV